eukprot:3678-Heterococcus_DN1.PRE.2
MLRRTLVALSSKKHQIYEPTGALSRPDAYASLGGSYKPKKRFTIGRDQFNFLLYFVPIGILYLVYIRPNQQTDEEKEAYLDEHYGHLVKYSKDRHDGFVEHFKRMEQGTDPEFNKKLDELLHAGKGRLAAGATPHTKPLDEIVPPQTAPARTTKAKVSKKAAKAVDNASATAADEAVIAVGGKRRKVIEVVKPADSTSAADQHQQAAAATTSSDTTAASRSWTQSRILPWNWIRGSSKRPDS